VPDQQQRAGASDRTDEDRTSASQASVLDEIEERAGFRAFFARHAWLDVSYRVAVGVVGVAVVVLGFVLIPLPGPGWLIVFAGLAILATEFAWAERLLRYARRKVRGWTDWVTDQSIVVRALIGLAGLLVVAGVFSGYLELYGAPSWLAPVLPSWVPGQ
jgi:uncharacterized protein (TIGR02611 family)